MTTTSESAEGGLSRLLNVVFRSITFLGNLALGTMLIIMAVEVALRSLELGTLWIADEMSAALLVATTFLGLSIAVREGALFRFDGIVSRLPEKIQVPYERLLYLLALIASSTLAWYLIKFVNSTWKRGTVSDGIIDYPLWIPQILMPLGMIAMVVAVLEKMLSPKLKAGGSGTHV